MNDSRKLLLAWIGESVYRANILRAIDASSNPTENLEIAVIHTISSLFRDIVQAYNVHYLFGIELDTQAIDNLHSETQALSKIYLKIMEERTLKKEAN